MYIVAIIIFLFIFNKASAQPWDDAINQIETEWAKIYYGLPREERSPAYQELLEKTIVIAQQYPNSSEVIYWQAIIKANDAEHHHSLAALHNVYESRDLLNKVIAMNPNTLEGSAYVALATLYFMVPPPPIAFGDDEQAEALFKTAMGINPIGIDVNYFYGNFLRSKKLFKEAEIFYQKALDAPIRDNQQYSDNQLKHEAMVALEYAKQHKTDDVRH